jgi:branched-chain amino acid transport system permease protein
VSDLFRKAAIRAVAAPAVAVLAIGAVGFFTGSFGQYLLAMVVISCVTGVALVMIVGYTRVIMLAAGAMMAIGAYGSAVLVLNLGVPYLATLPLVALAGLIGGVILAVPSMRFRGHHLAMVTMMFQFLVVTGIREWDSVTGGSMGLRVPPAAILGYTITSDLASLILVAVAGAFAVAVLGILLAGRVGKILRALSASEVGAEAFGVDIPRFRVAAFAISSGALAFAGALLGPRVRILDPDTFGLTPSIVALGYPIVGGMSSIWGGIIGGSVLRLLPEALRSLGQYQELLVAVLVVAVMVACPGGIMGLFRRLRPRGSPASQAAAKMETSTPGLAAAPAPWTLVPGDTAISLHRVRKSYDALVAVNDVSLDVPAGVIHGLIGPNGAGKTTLFNAISGLIPLDAGTISLFGTPVLGMPSRARIAHGVTRTFQHVAIFGDLSCLDNVIIGLGQNAVGHAIAMSVDEILDTQRYRGTVKRAMAALSEVGIGHLGDAAASTLSLGNQRRLEIARAIVSHPKLILLDEPVSGVARDEERRIAELLTRLNREHRITMFVIEHNIGFVRSLCSSISVMAAGEIIAHGKPDQVIALPEVRREYFGEANVAAA